MIVSLARRLLAISSVFALAFGFAAPAAAQEDNPVANFGPPPVLAATAGIIQPTLDDPTSAYLPGSSRQPVNAAVQKLATPLGRMRIPSIDLDQVILAGVDLSVLSGGPGHWVGTSRPGEAGNMVIAGHRTTYGAPFGDLNLLEGGDMIYYENDRGFDVMYLVTETLIVQPDDIWITYETGEAITTLFACHPKGSAANRIVVRARLVGGGQLA